MKKFIISILIFFANVAFGSDRIVFTCQRGPYVFNLREASSVGLGMYGEFLGPQVNVRYAFNNFRNGNYDGYCNGGRNGMTCFQRPIKHTENGYTVGFRAIWTSSGQLQNYKWSVSFYDYYSGRGYQVIQDGLCTTFGGEIP